MVFRTFIMTYQNDTYILFFINFLINATNGFTMPIRESLTLNGGKSLQSKLMMMTIGTSIVLQSGAAISTSKVGCLITLVRFFLISGICCGLVLIGLKLSTQPSSSIFFSSIFYLWFTFYNMSSLSMFWVIGAEVLGKKMKDVVGSFGVLASAGTLGHLVGSCASTLAINRLGSENSLIPLLLLFTSGALCVQYFTNNTLSHLKVKNRDTPSSLTSATTQTVRHSDDSQLLSSKDRKEPILSLKHVIKGIKNEIKENIATLQHVLRSPMLLFAMIYVIFISVTLGLTMIERVAVAGRTGLSKDKYGELLARNQVTNGLIQFSVQFFGSSTLTALLGPSLSLCAPGVMRTASFVALILLLHLSVRHPSISSINLGNYSLISSDSFNSFINWYGKDAETAVWVVMVLDFLCRLSVQSLSKPVREAIWSIPIANSTKNPSKKITKKEESDSKSGQDKDDRDDAKTEKKESDLKYRCKILIDVFGHRIGTSSAAILSGFSFAQLSNMMPLFGGVMGNNGNLNLPVHDHLFWGIISGVILSMSGFLLGSMLVRERIKLDNADKIK